MEASATAGTHCCPVLTLCALDGVPREIRSAALDKARAYERFIVFTYIKPILMMMSRRKTARLAIRRRSGNCVPL